MTSSEPAVSSTLFADLKPGDHLCCIYESEAEYHAVVAPYVEQGLECGDQVILVVGTHPAETILDHQLEE